MLQLAIAVRKASEITTDFNASWALKMSYPFDAVVKGGWVC